MTQTGRNESQHPLVHWIKCSLTPHQTLPQSLTRLLARTWMNSDFSPQWVCVTNTPLFILKDRVSQKLLVTQTVTSTGHEMQTWGWKWVLFILSGTISDFDYHFFSLSLSVPTQTDAEHCSRFCGTGRPLCVPVQRQSSHETRERMNTLSLPHTVSPSPPPFSLHRPNGVWGCRTHWLQR